MAGMVDWNAIEDRLRVPDTPSSWDSPKDIVLSAAKQYEKPRQGGQKIYLEVWVEKDALSGVLKRVTNKYHIPIMVNRGYSSASAMFDSFMRFINKGAYKERPVKILYLGDFDPSGLDMIRDIRERTLEFRDGYNDGYLVEEMDFSIEPIALTREQINQYNPPPNPAKLTDTRSADFVAEHGYTSWEVDALRPDVLTQILEDAITENINTALYKSIVAKEAQEKEKIEELTKLL
jgi:hypothetical protein